MADLNVGNGELARAHTVEPILQAPMNTAPPIGPLPFSKTKFTFTPLAQHIVAWPLAAPSRVKRDD